MRLPLRYLALAVCAQVHASYDVRSTRRTSASYPAGTVVLRVEAGSDVLNIREVQAFDSFHNLLSPSGAQLDAVCFNQPGAMCADGDWATHCHGCGPADALELAYPGGTDIHHVRVVNRIGYEWRMVGGTLTVTAMPSTVLLSRTFDAGSETYDFWKVASSEGSVIMKITPTPTQFLGLAEVRVYDAAGEAIPHLRADLPPYDQAGVAELCFDGVADDTGCNSKLHGQTLEVEFAPYTAIAHVQLVNRIDCCAERIHGAALELTVWNDALGASEVAVSGTVEGDVAVFDFWNVTGSLLSRHKAGAVVFKAWGFANIGFAEVYIYDIERRRLTPERTYFYPYTAPAANCWDGDEATSCRSAGAAAFEAGFPPGTEVAEIRIVPCGGCDYSNGQLSLATVHPDEVIWQGSMAQQEYAFSLLTSTSTTTLFPVGAVVLRITPRASEILKLAEIQVHDRAGKRLAHSRVVMNAEASSPATACFDGKYNTFFCRGSAAGEGMAVEFPAGTEVYSVRVFNCREAPESSWIDGGTISLETVPDGIGWQETFHGAHDSFDFWTAFSAPYQIPDGAQLLKISAPAAGGFSFEEVEVYDAAGSVIPYSKITHQNLRADTDIYNPELCFDGDLTSACLGWGNSVFQFEYPAHTPIWRVKLLNWDGLEDRNEGVVVELKEAPSTVLWQETLPNLAADFDFFIGTTTSTSTHSTTTTPFPMGAVVLRIAPKAAEVLSISEVQVHGRNGLLLAHSSVVMDAAGEGPASKCFDNRVVTVCKGSKEGEGIAMEFPAGTEVEHVRVFNSNDAAEKARVDGGTVSLEVAPNGAHWQEAFAGVEDVYDFWTAFSTPYEIGQGAQLLRIEDPLHDADGYNIAEIEVYDVAGNIIPYSKFTAQGARADWFISYPELCFDGNAATVCTGWSHSWMQFEYPAETPIWRVRVVTGAPRSRNEDAPVLLKAAPDTTIWRSTLAGQPDDWELWIGTTTSTTSSTTATTSTTTSSTATASSTTTSTATSTASGTTTTSETVSTTSTTTSTETTATTETKTSSTTAMETSTTSATTTTTSTESSTATSTETTSVTETTTTTTTETSTTTVTGTSTTTATETTTTTATMTSTTTVTETSTTTVTGTSTTTDTETSTTTATMTTTSTGTSTTTATDTTSVTETTTTTSTETTSTTVTGSSTTTATETSTATATTTTTTTSTQTTTSTMTVTSTTTATETATTSATTTTTTTASETGTTTTVLQRQAPQLQR